LHSSSVCVSSIWSIKLLFSVTLIFVSQTYFFGSVMGSLLGGKSCSNFFVTKRSIFSSRFISETCSESCSEDKFTGIEVGGLGSLGSIIECPGIADAADAVLVVFIYSRNCFSFGG